MRASVPARATGMSGGGAMPCPEEGDGRDANNSSADMAPTEKRARAPSRALTRHPRVLTWDTSHTR